MGEKAKTPLAVINGLYAVYKLVMVIIGLVHSGNVRLQWEELVESLSNVDIVIVNDPIFASPVHLLCANETISTSNYTDCQSAFDEFGDITEGQEYWSMLYLDPRDSINETKVSDMVSARKGLFIYFAVILSLMACGSCCNGITGKDQNMALLMNYRASMATSRATIKETMPDDDDTNTSIEMEEAGTGTAKSESSDTNQATDGEETGEELQEPKWAKITVAIYNWYISVLSDVMRMFLANLYTMGVDVQSGFYMLQYVPGYGLVFSQLVVCGFSCCVVPCMMCGIGACFMNENRMCFGCGVMLLMAMFLTLIGLFTVPVYGLMYYAVNFSFNVEDFLSVDDDSSLSEDLALDLAAVLDGGDFISAIIPYMGIGGFVFSTVIMLLKLIKICKTH